ncbi:hypothetical protein EKO27_g11255 [Xylaria grammica]|uniref:Amino acid permease/ SLC12A domain-containing protein n=1 Tax=Xylaria grammica TaxID=363999 RepID=A0A439CNW5_9PEZI|nr:hypothetical protein EKO27_g11255 [Xylaria grammica]
MSTKMGVKSDAMVSGDHFGETDSDTADQLLTSLGYKPELLRTRSTFQVAFMSFVLASVPYGLATTLYYPLVCGGPVDIIWGWVAVSLIIVCVAASLGEITSVYPTAGGVYYQAFMLAPMSYRRLAAWVCGWLYVVGNITITLSVNFATALFLVASVNVFQAAAGEDVLAGSAYQVFLIFLGVTLICNLTFAIFWTFVGIIAILITVLVVARHGRNNASYVFGHFEVNSGWRPGWSFFVGLLHAAYATSSTGMILSMCEEVRAPATQVPKAMVLTILFNLAAGLVTLIPLVFVIDDIQYLISLAQPVPAIIKSAVGSSGGAFWPAHPSTRARSHLRYWLHHRYITLHLWFLPRRRHSRMVIQIALGLIYFGSSAAFNAFSGVGVIALTAAYSAPIFVSMLEGRKTVTTGSFYLGKLGWFCNIVSVSWTLLVIPLFSMPTTVPVVDPSLVNYAPVVFVGFTLISLGWYLAWGRKHYIGPPT